MNKSYITLKQMQVSELKELKYGLISNSNFQKIWCNLANNLGFFGCRGDENLIVGNNMVVFADGDEFFIKGQANRKNNKKLKITFSNFKLSFIGDTLTTQASIIQDFKPETVSSTNYINRNTNSANIIKKIVFMQTDTTIVTSSHKIATSVGVDVDFKLSLPGVSDSTSLNYNFSHDYTFGNQEDKINIKQNVDQVSLDIEPGKKIPIKLISGKNMTTIPYEALAIISFNVTFDGYLNKRRKAYKKQLSSNTQLIPFSYTFGNDSISAVEDLKQQITRKSLPNQDWDWNFVTLRDREFFTTILPSMFNGFAYKFTGEFNKINSTNVVFEIGPNVPI